MPVPLWTTTNKAEARYNVVTEFPQLGLHAAAASGNVGLVEYALKHGQPINSVLDGVLPIHAASAGGHPQVVKKLIEHGADVNAPRLPRRYFSDKNRDASAPIVGTSGSTPLHFAAANGNTNVITLLLLHGAHPDRADKYGVTPEALARENNWVECADILHNWVLNKDRDLREREALLPNGNGAASSGQREQTSGFPEPESPSFRRRLHVKQSIDTALNILKTSSHSDTSLRPYPSLSAASPPPSPMVNEFDSEANAVHPTSRRPSLPHALQPPPAIEEQKRGKSTSSARRPRSAGNGAERSPEQEPVYLPHGRGGQGRKLGSKLSLLGLFKKGQHADGSEGSNTSTPPRLSNSSTPLPLTPTSSSFNRLSPGSTFEASDAADGPLSRNHASSDASLKVPKIIPQPNGHLRPPGSFLELDSPISPPHATRSPPPLPSAVDLHNALAHRQQGRDRSRSNATTVSTFSDLDSEDEQGRLAAVSKAFKPSATRDRSGSSTAPPPNLPDIAENKAASTLEDDKLGYPPGILKGHRRTGSNSQASPSPVRALRFDSMSTPDRMRKEASSTGSPSSHAAQLKPSTSSQSLKPSIRDDPRIQYSPRVYVEKPLVEDGLPLAQGRYHSPPLDEADEAEDVEFNRPELPPRTDLKSFETTAQSSLSPLFGEETAVVTSLTVASADFPFSIRRPPPVAEDSTESRLQVNEADRRGRGDSISSTCTADSTSAPQYSTSGSTIGSYASPMISTPNGSSTLPLPSTEELDEDDDTYQGIVRQGEPAKELVTPAMEGTNPTTLIERRAQSPLDIDIRAISSHAEADALVEKTRQHILDLASGHSVVGSTPLSARLAAYGESLALQRKLKEREEAARLARSTPPTSAQDRGFKSAPVDHRRNGVERQLSLGKPAPSRVKSKDPRRPSTADGLSTRPQGSFFPGEAVQTIKPSASVSPSGAAGTSTSYDERRQLSPPHQRFPTSLSTNTSLLSAPEPFISPAPARSLAVDADDDLESFTSESMNTEMGNSPVIRHVASFSSAGARNKPIPGRTAGSAKKLNRMGFTVVDQIARPPPPQPPQGKLRGGFKSIMQSLKGKP